jgi:hypothetical protein
MSSSTTVTDNNVVVVRYWWIIDLKENLRLFLANSSREYVRIMGTIVAIQDIPKEDLFLEPLLTPTLSNNLLMDQTSNATTNHKLMTLDDGTEIISIWTSQSMIDELMQQQILQEVNSFGSSSETNPENSLLLGLTLDCIIKLRQTASHRRWFAETLIPLHDTLEEEQQHRWILLSHQQKYFHTTTTTTHDSPSMYSHDFGFPTRRHDTAKLYHLIHAHSNIQQKAYDRRQQKENKWLGKRKRLHENRRPSAPTNKSFNTPFSNTATNLGYSSSNNKRGTIYKSEEGKAGQASFGSIPQTPSKPEEQPLVLKGLTLDDLTCVMQQSEQIVQGMIQELQLEGRVYRNSQGEYLPL